MRRLCWLVAFAFALVACGCSSRAVRFEPRLEDDVTDLMTDMTVLPPFPEPEPGSGSLWHDGGTGAALFRDAKAFRLNDLLTIVLDERSLGTNQSETDLNRSSEADFGAGVALGLEDPTPQSGSFNWNQVLSTSSESSFSGDGTTSRSSRLSAMLTVRVLRVLPNGDLIIAGQKNIIVNRERQVLTLVGSVRPFDILANNRVSSSAVGDLTVRLWGRGEVDASIRQGWFMRVMNRLWPF